MTAATALTIQYMETCSTFGLTAAFLQIQPRQPLNSTPVCYNPCRPFCRWLCPIQLLRLYRLNGYKARQPHLHPEQHYSHRVWCCIWGVHTTYQFVRLWGWCLKVLMMPVLLDASHLKSQFFLISVGHDVSVWLFIPLQSNADKNRSHFEFAFCATWKAWQGHNP